MTLLVFLYNGQLACRLACVWKAITCKVRACNISAVLALTAFIIKVCCAVKLRMMSNNARGNERVMFNYTMECDYVTLLVFLYNGQLACRLACVWKAINCKVRACNISAVLALTAFIIKVCCAVKLRMMSNNARGNERVMFPWYRSLQ